MLKKTIIGFMLALFAGPLSAHAELPGQPCTAAQIGTTKMADDKQNIIACLKTGDTTPGANVSEWKAMTMAADKGYSLTCTDWKAKRFSSKDDCIMDGRWHLVYANDAAGNTTYGSLQDLKTYGYDYGAEVKNADEEGTHYCQTFSYRSGVANCMDGARIAGQVFSTTMSSNDGTINIGAATRRSDGVRLAANVVRSTNGLAEASNGRPPNSLFKWYIRF